MKTITESRSFVTKALFFILFLSAALVASSASAQTLTSDHLDYAPGDTATLTGTGFQPGETVTVQVVNANGSPNSNDTPFNVTADANGNFIAIWAVPADSSAWLEMLLATADGQTSGLHAECTFTDASTFDTIDFQQASNQGHPTVPISWINGILNPNNSDYFEGIGVPQRVLFTGIVPTPGDTHALTFRHQALKGGVHAYDFLMSWPQAVSTAGAIGGGPTNELLNLMAQQCDAAISSDGLGACTTATNVLAIDVPDIMGDPPGITCGFPPYPNTTNSAIQCFEGIFGNRQIHIYGNQPILWGELLFSGYVGSGDVYATYTLRWKSTSTSVKILIAGRSSQSCSTAGCCGYGAGCGSGSVSGGPYHFKLDDLDGHTTGSQDNQLQANAAPAAPTCDSILISGPDSVCPGSSGNIYTATVNGPCSNATHHWSITGTGVIVGSSTGASVSVLAGVLCGSQFSICDTITCDEGQVVCCKIINVVDHVLPVITCPNPTPSVECPNTPNFGNATATDNCDTQVGITADDVTTPGTCPAEYTVTRTWTASDNCNNTSSCSRTVTVTDNTAPSITCPTVSNVECPGSPNFGAATASDLCDPTVVPTSSDVTTPGTCPAEFSVTRTWTATDDCGNSSTCSRTISVTDNTAPSITCPNPASSVECPNTPNFGAATASDLCDPTVVPTSSDVTTPGTCPAEYSVTRTWTATDDCGNSSTCSRTISVTDNTAPSITCPTVTPTIECPNTPSFGAATASDLCDPTVVPTASNVTTPGTCPAEFSVTRTWTATDDCGNSSTCSRTISVTDNTAPSITCPNPAPTVECPNSPTFGAATASDLCDPTVVPTSSDVTTPGTCPAEFSVTRTWTATDDCGNSSTCSRTISVEDNTAPSITCPNPATSIECPNTPNFGAATASDLCDPTVTPTSSDVTTPGTCPAEFSVTRTWTATDDCGNSSTCSRTISVTDNTAPSITCPNPATSIECPNTPNFGAATASDLCDPTVVPTSSDVTTPGTCPAEFSVTRTWTATDDCGNSSTCSRTISVTDNTAPSITCPNPASSIECPNTPNFGSATASDLCDPTVIPTSSDVTTPGTCPAEFSVTRTWTATDDCGNSSTCSRTISVTDNTAPSITCPTVADVECPNPLVFGAATASDLCDPTVVPTFSDVTTSGQCPFTVTRTWTATDDCGNSSTCSRTISVTDNTPPSITCPNPATSVECPNSPSFGIATASDLCDISVAITNSNVTTPGTCPAEFSVTRTWTATDDCNNSSTCSRTISVTDNTAPSITCPTVTPTVECPNTPSFGAATASDLCDPTVVPTASNVTTPGTCPAEFSVTRTWTATDDCGNSSTCSRTISVTDNTPPSITCPNPATSVECPNSPNFGAATASDLCDPTVVPTSSDVTTPGTCPAEFSVTRTWTATDDCGNSSTCSRTISVTDNTAPSITCPNPASSIECPNSPNFGAATASDLCDPTVVPTSSDVTTPGTCPAEFSVTRTWTATDDCGNSSTCSRTISVTDNTAPSITCPNPAPTVECPNSPSFGAATASDLCDPTVVPTASNVTTPGTCPAEFSVTRTWTATDDCGNSSTCSRTISVTDNTAPSITCPNPAPTVECPNSPNFGSASASDLCDPTVVPNSSDVTTPGTCPAEFSVTRTWTATDDCGNSSTCSRTISVTDNTAPSITCPNPAPTVECPNSPSFGAATASDLCDPTVVPTASNVTTPGTCPAEFSVTRTWTATDDCGNSSTCSRTISVTDNTAPSITCPNPAPTVECPNSPNFGSATASDLCDPTVVPTASNVTTPGACPQEFTVTRTWTATDDCGNSSTCSRTINVEDNTAPSITCPNPSPTVECPNTPNFGSATASDLCDPTVVPTSSDVTTPGNCPQEYSVTRTWTATDDCGNASTCSRTVAVEDNTAPSITCPVVTSPVECPATPSFGSATASDLCDISVVPTSSDVTTPGACAGEYSVTRTWTATDDCGNASTCSRTINVEDNTAPSLTCPADETVPGAPSNSSSGPCTDLGGGGVATMTNPNSNAPHSHVGIDFRQPRNEGHPAVPLRWKNGVNNHTQAEYFEGMGNPQRIILTGLSGTTHTLLFRHEAVKHQQGDRHAYDFMMSWDQAVATAAAIGNNAQNELQNLIAQTCNTEISATAGSACSLFTSFFPPDTRIATTSLPDNMGNPPNHHGTANVNDVIQCFESTYGDRTIEMRGDAPITAFNIVFNGYSGSATGDNYAWYTITWTSTSDEVMIKLAGRAAMGGGPCGYGNCFGAGSISGAPYHFKLDLLDGYSTGNRDNQLMVDVEGCDVNIPVTFGTPDVSDECDSSPDVTVVNSDSVTTNSDGSITHCRTWEATDDCGNSSQCSQCITVSCDSAFVNGPPQIVENPYELHCTQTQSFWGSSSNGHLTCSGDNSDDAKLWLLTSFGNINIGCAGNSLALTASDVSCLNTRLPANGSDARIFGNNTCNSLVGIQTQGNGRFRNKLLGNTISLVINMRLDVTLGDVHLDGQYLLVQESTGCDVDAVPSGSIHTYSIPANVITYLGSNNSVNDLIALANAALCGSYLPSAGTPTLKEISKAVESINNAFDGCRFLLGFSNTLRDGAIVNDDINTDGPIAATAFPNPFNSNTTIRFALDNDYDNVKLEIFNAIGEVVSVPFNGAANAGVTYTVEFDGNNQPGGVYFYRISAGTETYLDKLMLIK